MTAGSDGSGTYSAMATLIRFDPERWRVDSVGTFANTRRGVSVYIERMPVDPAVDAALASASPVDIWGNQTVDGREHDIDGNLISGTGFPGVLTTTDNPLPSVSGSGEVLSIVNGSTVEYENGTTPPSPMPSNYPVNNTLDPNAYPYTPAGALNLPAKYQTYFDSIAQTTMPCTLSGLTVLNMSFPTGNAGGGCSYSGSGVLIVHNPRYDPRYFDPSDPLYNSSTSPIQGQTAAQYRADSANAPRYFNYNAANTFKGIIIADTVGEIGPGISGNAAIVGTILSLDRVNGSIGTGNAKISYSTAAIQAAKNSMPYVKASGTFRQLLPQ
jgi:hypothetical protein